MGAGRRLGIAENFNPVVDLFLELVFVDEAIDLHGAEEVADTAWSEGGRLQYTRVGGV